MADYSYGADAPETGFRASTLVNLTGAVLSLALVAGVGVWSYKLVKRDVSGIPVVRAIEGPMREQPADPGGEVALHRGLSVNAVAAEGQAGAPEDRLTLAPRDIELAAEDLELAPAVPDPVIEASADADDSAEALAGISAMVAEAADEIAGADPLADALLDNDVPLTADQIQALADQIAQGVAPLTALDMEAGEVQLALDGAPVVSVIPASVPGVSRSLRPQPRPMRISGIEPTAARTPSASDLALVDPATIPPGTRLVQLGAFESEAVAAAQWRQISGRFADYMGGKAPVIQQTESAGRTLWRLRATGFEDLSEARRFCAALVAEDALCMSVVSR
ncbi:SPOR domain-containing protein [Roseisalinus antarcticus]|uniref:Sporulation related domain protein n=1 Tax=Roseisalinus antarcticus TaxID=254357 RepID=A0A1Y5RCE4_9RHOB|nr:SPOR domain-containing protein [Roseisalinus antarcticus]SLN13847.1 Sporulation related domain protein [Roseisalinus antarcticus]